MPSAIGLSSELKVSGGVNELPYAALPEFVESYTLAPGIIVGGPAGVVVNTASLNPGMFDVLPPPVGPYPPAPFPIDPPVPFVPYPAVPFVPPVPAVFPPVLNPLVPPEAIEPGLLKFCKS